VRRPAAEVTPFLTCAFYQKRGAGVTEGTAHERVMKSSELLGRYVIPRFAERELPDVGAGRSRITTTTA